ncbi:SprT-like domain-containing protein spartan [Bacillus phage vB_BanS_Nate]|uniref:SprT-like domain-containing protein spartan n=1 Tax=Bacillus phage vB_BanS_Nate TaxID=2894788 RepID=A0AAE8YUD3_9CAUD|nr:SprT-like domain-containing protein spartan [Bacillus phage vB_BanS_Nate]UGO50948.1 SprT-like domain-containing protein spartan [Bacillus phage vB_BanS_Nate]
MTETQLARYANKFLMENYGMRLTVPLKLNGRLSKTLGWFVSNRKTKKPVAVHLNKKFVQNNDEDIILNVLKHELVHFALFMQGKPHSDGQTYFENELKRKGIVSQSTINQYTVNSVKQVYRCKSCNFMHKKTRKFSNVSRYQCRCGGALEYIGKRVVAS